MMQNCLPSNGTKDQTICDSSASGPWISNISRLNGGSDTYEVMWEQHPNITMIITTAGDYFVAVRESGSPVPPRRLKDVSINYYHS